MNLGDSVEYNTLVRVTSPYDRLATAIIKLFVHYNVWSAVYSDNPDNYSMVCDNWYIKTFLPQGAIAQRGIHYSNIHCVIFPVVHPAGYLSITRTVDHVELSKILSKFVVAQ